MCLLASVGGKKIFYESSNYQCEYTNFGVDMSRIDSFTEAENDPGKKLEWTTFKKALVNVRI